MLTEQALRVVTINTGKCDGSYHRRVDLLAKGLRALEQGRTRSMKAIRDSLKKGQ